MDRRRPVLLAGRKGDDLALRRLTSPDSVEDRQSAVDGLVALSGCFSSSLRMMVDSMSGTSGRNTAERAAQRQCDNAPSWSRSRPDQTAGVRSGARIKHNAQLRSLRQSAARCVRVVCSGDIGGRTARDGQPGLGKGPGDAT